MKNNSAKLKISKLLPAQRGRYVDIYINGDFEISVHKDIFTKFKLEAGKIIDKQERQSIIKAEVKRKLRIKVLKKLSRRMHSEKEIFKYLKRRIFKIKKEQDIEIDESISENIINEIIDKLKQEEYIDDFEFARVLIDNKKKKKSKMEIKKYLIKKGIDYNIIDKVLNQKVFCEDNLIKKLIKKKRRILEHKKLKNSKLRQKIIQYLMRKGFRYQEISDQLDQMD